MPDADEFTGEISDADGTSEEFNDELLRAKIDFGTAIVVQQCVDFLRDRIDRFKRLAEELTAPEKIFIGYDGAKFNITPKTRAQMSETLKKNWKGQTIHEKLKRSPDKADSAVIWYEAFRHRGIDLDAALKAGMF